MRERWSFEEDFIVATYYLSHIDTWKEHLDELMGKLAAAGYGNRNIGSAKMRIQNYQYLHTGLHGLSNPATQSRKIYNGIMSARVHSTLIQVYIANNYSPSITGGTINLSETNDMMDFVCPKKLGASFSEVLFELIGDNRTDPQVYKACQVSKQTFSDIRSNKANVSKKTVLQLCVGMELSYEDSLRLMEAAGFTFSKSIMTDVIIEWHLKERIYDKDEIDCALFDNKAKTLFAAS